MNRFRSRTKSHGGETADNSRRPSLETEVPAMPLFSSKTFKRKKKAVPEPKPEVDISAALPAQEDFRTSLLMPNLSARFSMLREQDDPTSKIGKANDDSVLFPKRVSRLDLFSSRNGLSDIAEVDSLRGSIRPPFTSTARAESYGSDGYGTDDGSVMSRSRPGEGNTMFGGRQKIYKIPVGASGSVKNFGGADDGDLPAGGNMGGKALYESDIATSAFQKLREQEREETERKSQESFNLRSSREQDRSGSPPSVRYNRNRETASSTNSAPSYPRTSTAATSVASHKSTSGNPENGNGFAQSTSSNGQPNSASSDRPFPKSRRLYGQGLDQHMYEQQSSALNRLESLHRQRPAAAAALPKTRNLQLSRSASNLGDRFQQGGPLYASNGFRAGSPPPSATPPTMADFDLGLNEEKQTNASNTDSGYGRSPPLSPTMSPNLDPHSPDSTLVAALEPNDIGKATASGAFNKPSKQYDDQQYLQRQMRLQEGRGSPSPQLIRPFSPPATSLDEHTNASSRNNSLGGGFSRSNSIRQPWEHHMEDRVLRAVPERADSPSIRRESSDQPNIAMERSFFAGMSSGEVSPTPESEPELGFTSSASSQKGLNYSHPAHSPPTTIGLAQPLNFDPSPKSSPHLAEPIEDNVSDSRSYKSEATITQHPPPTAPENGGPKNMNNDDSPTLGPVGVSNGLSGIVRAHLRNDSGQSSIYPEDSPRKSRHEARESIFGHGSALNEQRDGSWNEVEEHNAHPMPPPLSHTARNILEQATQLRNLESAKAKQTLGGNDKAQRILGGEAPRSSHETQPASWQDQLKAHHARAASTETQKEREDLAHEMAERRRLVQDKLQTYVETESRESSPAPAVRTHENTQAKAGHPFGILKKSSKGSLIGKQEKPSKAMKMLGMDPGAAPGPNGVPQDLFRGRDQLTDRAMPPRQRAPMRSALSRPREPDPRPFASSSRSSKSSSAYSDTSDRRSESRKGSIANDSMERGRVNGYSPRKDGSDFESQSQRSAPRSTEDIQRSIGHPGLPPSGRSQSAMGNRSRSNSKPMPPGHFDRAAPPGTPYMINPNQSSRPTANPHPYTSHSQPSLREPSSAALASRPVMINPQNKHAPPPSSIRLPPAGRKRSVNKHDISEPTFISCTSSVDVVNLPPGASLQNGIEPLPSPGIAPPIPARDSRRKRTQTLLHALGRLEKSPSVPQSPVKPMHSPQEDPYEERSNFSADDEPGPPLRNPWQKQKLRKTSSDAGNMYIKTRQPPQEQQQTQTQAPSPAMPQSPFTTSPMIPQGSPAMSQSPFVSQAPSPRVPHAPYQAQQDVPASAVMF